MPANNSANSQNKRQKQSNNDQYSNSSSNLYIEASSTIHSIARNSTNDESLSSKELKQKSDPVNALTLDNDTLQNMKNLDLNQDLPK